MNLGSADEVQRLAGLFVRRRPVSGRSEGGGGAGRVDIRGLRERSQFAGGRQSWHSAEAVQIVLERLARGVLGLLSSPADLGIGAVPGAFEGGDLALDADQEFGGGGVGEQCGGEGCARGLGEESAVEIGLDAQEAALLPIGAEHGVDVEVFGGGFGAELAVVVGGEGLIIGGIFAGDDEGGGVDAVFESVEAGGGLALGGAGSGRFLRVGLIGRDLS